MKNGLYLEVTYGAGTSPLYLSDLTDGTDGPAGYQKSGPLYLNPNTTSELMLTTDVVRSFESGMLRGFINAGLVTCRFLHGQESREVGLRTITANDNLVAGDQVLMVDTAAGNVVVTLPSAADVVVGAVYTVKRITSDANHVTIDPVGAETIDGDGSILMNTALESQNIYSDGTNWWVL